MFVDASGDSGTRGRGSRWLVIAGVADTGLPGALESRLAQIRSRSRYPDDKPIHFTGRPHDYKRGVLEVLADEAWVTFVVASDTTAIREDAERGLAVPQTHYNYAMKYVLERASQFARACNEDLTFTIEQSGNFSLDAFVAYVRRLRSSEQAVDWMDWSVVDERRITEAAKSGEHRLSVADGVVHAFYRALTPEREFGHYEDAYARIVSPHLWRHPNGSALRRGITFMPTSLQATYLDQFPWIEEIAAG